jgi:hypothetical protein
MNGMDWHEIAGLIAGLFGIVGYLVYAYTLFSKKKNINPDLGS